MNPLVYAAFAAGFLMAGGISAVGGWAYNSLIENPAIERDTRKVCVSQATEAALEAQLAAQRRAQERIDALNQQFDAATQRRAAEAAHINKEMQDGITAFEAAGRSQCAVTVDNLEFLRP